MNRNASRTASRTAAAAAGLLLVGAALAGCSSSSGDESSAAASSAAPAASDGADEMGTAEMRALCDEVVAGTLSPEDATALVEENGYVARVGTIDGEPQALTMDLREDRFTFEVANGAVTACTYG